MYGYALFKNDKFTVINYPSEGFTEDVTGKTFHHGGGGGREGAGVGFRIGEGWGQEGGGQLYDGTFLDVYRLTGPAPDCLSPRASSSPTLMTPPSLFYAQPPPPLSPDPPPACSCIGRFIQKLREAVAQVPAATVRQALVRRLVNGKACRAEGEGGNLTVMSLHTL